MDWLHGPKQFRRVEEPRKIMWRPFNSRPMWSDTCRGRGETFAGEIKGLRVPVFIVRAVREQMRFDTPRIVVETGQGD